MKQLKTFHSVVLILWVLGLNQSQAQLLWGTNGNGGSGTWDGTTADWYNGTSNVPWTSGDAATFSGTGGVVGVSGSQTASQLTFNSPGYTLTGGFLEGTSSGLTIQTNSDATIDSAIFGASPYSTTFTKTGNGTLTLEGAFAFFSQVTIASGDLFVDSFGASSAQATYVLGSASNASLTFAAGGTYFLGNLSGGATGGGAVSPGTAAGGTTNLEFFDTVGGPYAGSLQDNGSNVLSITLASDGTLTLTGANTYSGATQLASSGATLVLSGGGTILNSPITDSGMFEIDNSGTNNNNRISDTANFSMSGGTFLYQGNAGTASTETVGTLNVIRGASTVTVNAGSGQTAMVTFEGLSRSVGGGTVNFNGTGTTQIAGATNTNGIVGGYATFNGTDWATVNGSNGLSAYSGYTSNINSSATTDNVKLSGMGTTALTTSTTINSLNLVNAFSLPNQGAQILDLGTNTLILSSGGLLSSGSTSFTPITIQNGSLTSSGAELIVTDAGDVTINANIIDASSPVALTKSGAGILNLGGNNSYSGATSIQQGTIQIQSSTALPSASSLFLNGTLNLNSFNATVAGLNGAGSVALGSGTLNVNQTGLSTFSGVISGTGGLTKSGAGTLVLEGENTYTGPTRITGGNLTLLEVFNPILSSNTAITLSNAKLTVNYFGPAPAQSLGTLSLQGNSVIDFSGSLNLTLSFANSSAQNWGGNTITIENFNPTDTLQFGSSSTGLTANQLSDFIFTDFGNMSAQIDANGDVTAISAVPEPNSTVLLVVGIMLLIPRCWRKRVSTSYPFLPSS